MRRRIKVLAKVIATVMVNEDISGNQEIDDIIDIEEIEEFEEVQ